MPFPTIQVREKLGEIDSISEVIYVVASSEDCKNILNKKVIKKLKLKE